MKLFKLITIVILLVFTSDSMAKFELPPIIDHYMVLQQSTEANLWGWIEPGEDMEVSPDWLKQSFTAKADKDGRWELKVPTHKAGGPYTITFKSGQEIRTIREVMLGEVWICSGQSNMDMPLEKSWAEGVLNYQHEIANSNKPLIRLFTLDRWYGSKPKEKFGGRWRPCLPETSGAYSAVAYFFAREITEKLGIPVGLIHTSWGGTPAEAWTSEKVLRILGDFDKQLDLVKAKPPATQNDPSVLYNTMIAPLLSYNIKGAIWYQGESNVGRAEQYKKLFPAMIKCWRDDWGLGNFPFYFVQLAPYAYEWSSKDGLAYLRQAQFETMKAVANTGMVVTTDAGNLKDIHPRNKQAVGKRLALWALAKTYGVKDIVWSGPLYKDHEIEGDKIRIFFDHADAGLVCKGNKLIDFTIAGKDRKFVSAEARIEGSTVVVYADEVKIPAAVRFGWANVSEPNLFNRESLPAGPFRTDNWE